MDALEDTYRASHAIENSYPEKRILFIGSESYDAPVITVLQGLVELGFKIYTIKKWNINSWFCNQVIENPSSLKYDFILSDLHWGTRWTYYETFGLQRYPKVLIDGSDNRNWSTWREKYEYYKSCYVFEPPDEVKNLEVAPYRWVEPIGEYSPDIVFASQKQRGDQTARYLPFGINKEYLSLAEGKKPSQRLYDFVHIEGPGWKRTLTRHLLDVAKATRILPGSLFNGSVFGEKIVSDTIRSQLEFEQSDRNIIHGYFRWALDRAYFRLLNNSKVLIYPGIDRFPFWDSKRPWESYASGCVVLLSKPSIDVSEYPPTEICSFANYSSPFELIDKCRFLFRTPAAVDRYATETITRSHKYFSPISLARYFLVHIKNTVK